MFSMLKFITITTAGIYSQSMFSLTNFFAHIPEIRSIPSMFILFFLSEVYALEVPYLRISQRDNSLHLII